MNSTSLYQAQENLRMLETCPTWYEHKDKVEAAIAEEERIYKYALMLVGNLMKEDGMLHHLKPMN